MNSGDVLARRRCQVESLDELDPQEGEWRQALVADTRTPYPTRRRPSELDFPAWLSGLGSRRRAVAQSLAASYTTRVLAEEHGISPGRVSQMRRELHEAWDAVPWRDGRFCGRQR